MVTCLSGLWDILLEQYYNVKNIGEVDCKQEMCNVISKFYEDSKSCKPIHIEVFQHNLSRRECSICDAAKIADKESKTCDLCVSCLECAKKFYDVLQGKKEERPLPLELKNYFSDSSQLYYYLDSYKTVKSYRRIDNTLICLKGFSSTTPAIYSAVFENTCVGGGLYLNVDGFGIAIDPGIGFVDSMHKQGIFIEDINAVVVTHNHLDHNADIGTISALSYDINRYYSSQVKFYDRFFEEVNHKEHTISWWLDEGTQDTYKGVVSSSKVLSQCDKWTMLNDKVSMLAFETKHMREGKSYGVKYKINLNDIQTVIGYTSDTKFFPEMAEFMEECDIIVFNISDIYEKDVRGIKQKNSHLGYDGSLNLLQGEKQKFQLAIASEFCCSNGDYRVRAVRELKEHVKKERAAHIIPGEVGLKVDIQSRGIYCSHCKRIIPLDLISVVTPEHEFGTIHYICNNCRYM